MKTTDNSSKIILDLCGGTGSWSRPYKEAGYDVRLITLPGYDVMKHMFNVDYLFFPYIPEIDFGDERFVSHKNMNIFIPDIYGILAAPTCTMFSLARTTAKTPRDFNEGMELVKKCLEIIWFCRGHKDSGLHFWALENPLGYLRQFLGKPQLTFEPSDYGDTYTKKTDLWGFYNRPQKKKRKLTDDEIGRCRVNKRILPELPTDYIVPGGWNKHAARRSMTSACFSQAFFNANK